MLQAVMEMKGTLGEVSAKIDRLISGADKLSGKLSDVDRSVDQVKTGAYVAGVILAAVLSLAWWAIGDRIGNAVKGAILSQQVAPASVPPVPKAP